MSREKALFTLRHVKLTVICSRRNNVSKGAAALCYVRTIHTLQSQIFPKSIFGIYTNITARHMYISLPRWYLQDGFIIVAKLLGTRVVVIVIQLFGVQCNCN